SRSMSVQRRACSTSSARQPIGASVRHRPHDTALAAPDSFLTPLLPRLIRASRGRAHHRSQFRSRTRCPQTPPAVPREAFMSTLISVAFGISGLGVLVVLAAGLVLDQYQTPAEAVDW